MIVRAPVLFVWVLAILGVLATTAIAAPSRVVVLRDAAADPALSEAAIRLEAELRAAGFDVVARPLAPAAEPRAALEQAARESGAFAAVVLFRAKAGAAADIWIVDRLTGKTLIRTVEVGGANAASDLAVRASELLHASLLETARPAETRPRKPDNAVPADVKRWAYAADERRPFAGLTVEAAVGVLGSAGGIGPSFAPQLRLAWGHRSGFAARLSVVGPAVGASLQSPLGRAEVRQELAALSLVYAVETGSFLVPVFSAGAGGYHLLATGSPDPPYTGRSDDAWAALVHAGAGAGARLSQRVMLLLDLHAILLLPRPVVTLAGAELGHAGRPSALLSFGVVVSLL
jgi:hypothetical protein